VALFGSIYTLQYIESGGQSTNAIGGAVILLSSAIKALSFADRNLMREHNKIPTLLLFFGIIIAFVILYLEETDYRLFFVTISGIFISVSTILYLLYNKKWLGLSSVKYCVSVLSASVVALVFLLATAFPIGSKTRFIPSESRVPYHVVVLAVLIFLFHMAFIGLIIGRQARENMLQLRKSIRVREAVNQSKSRERESAVLADERYHLLKMLTHEVRQPMNSAQAALQALSHKIRSGSETPEYVKKTIENAGSTLNSIILSISNSILGATLITKGRAQNLEVTDICCVVDLAMLDIDQIEAQRFEKKFDQPVMFTDADPIILRLGVRTFLKMPSNTLPATQRFF
jgi:signal transduction histidine kinase